ncbi:hypothetical protein ACFV3G_23810, partial [Streptomyces sp. NPDC059712]
TRPTGERRPVRRASFSRRDQSASENTGSSVRGDRGVVAVLDQRLATARYGSYLKASLPDFWFTTDRNQVRKSLAAIDAKARQTEAAGQAESG